MEEQKIEAVAFTMWLSFYHTITGAKGNMLTYWEHYDLWLVHEEKQSYIDHVRRSVKRWNTTRTT